MSENRIRELLRDPTLDQPALDYYEVRLPWQSFAVRQESAERILEAMLGQPRVDWVRAETVTGSVIYLRAEHIVFVREWSQAQRDTERRFWKQIDKEYEEDEKNGSESPEAPTDGEASSESGVKAPEQDAGAGIPDLPGATHADLVRFVVVTVVVLTIVRLMLG